MSAGGGGHGRTAQGRVAVTGARPGSAVLLLAAALVLAGAWSYSTSFRGVLVLDDIRAIVLNESIRSLSSALVPPGERTVSGRPVANLSLALNYALAPADARNAFVARPGGPPAETVLRNLWGYHLLNLVVHLLAALALLGVLRRTFTSPELVHVIDGPPGSLSSGAGIPPSTWLTLAVALLWVVHPLQTEAVTYVIQRVESLMALFYLLTLYCAMRAWEGRGARWWSAAAIGSCALGIATKEVMVGAPLMVVAWDWLFASRRATLRRRLPLYAGLAATWIVLALLVAHEHRAPSIDLGEGMSWRYLATQAGVLTHYLRLAFVPAPLVFLYTWPIEPSFAAVAPQAVLMVVLVLLTIWGLVRRHPLSIAGAWFFLILAPTSSVLPIVTEVAAEHRMYLPLASVIATIVVGTFLAGRIAVRRVLPASPRGALVPSLIAATIVAGTAATLAGLTRDRNRDYWSEEALWRDTVEKQPSNLRARVAYGVALFTSGQVDEAEAQLRAAVALRPDDPTAAGRLGGVLAQQGKVDEAIRLLERAAALTSRGDPQVLMVLAAAQAQAGRFGHAATTASEAEQVARAQGRMEMAAELARRAAAYAARAFGQ